MAKHNEKDVAQLQRDLETEYAKLQEERRQLQEQRIQMVKESEKVAENKRQFQEELKKWELHRNNTGTSNSMAAGVRRTMSDTKKFSLSEDFELWFEQFQEFLTLNNVTEEETISLFIMKIGAERYRLLRNLCSPTLPKNRTLNELATLI